MQTITYVQKEPTLNGYQTLYKSTGWKYATPVTRENLETALSKTWRWVCAYEKAELAGIGRLISDGALYALLCDLIVLPEFQRQGIGSTMLNILVSEAKKQDIKRLWLFAATDKASFYERFGFEVRPPNAPGMQFMYKP